ncbi:MAG: hypothetical protein CTY31_01775 [Hyphomicrobium sp.]|nr:MAG: hypothetical protein CTY39_09145 [Hyphomicrobium sp.]PPD01519.1 MAG: hypothetical protein CTY31_01775 [Hyphomicrobium sp.]
MGAAVAAQDRGVGDGVREGGEERPAARVSASFRRSLAFGSFQQTQALRAKGILMFRFLGGLIGIFAMLIIELVVTMLVYVGLNLYSFELFGTLVRYAGAALEMMAALVERVFASSANTAYASVFGELGPKSMLLLLIGLVVAAVLRVLVGAVRG